MSIQATCIDGSLSDRLCHSLVPPPVFNITLPLIDESSTPATTTTSILSTVVEATTYKGPTTTTSISSTVEPTTYKDYVITASPLPPLTIVDEVTWTETSAGSITNISYSPTLPDLLPTPSDNDDNGSLWWIIFPVVVICIIAFVVVKLIIRWRNNRPCNPKDKEIQSTQMVCDGKVKKTVTEGSVELTPNTDKCTETQCIEIVTTPGDKVPVVKYEAPGTPILNVPCDVDKSNYEDITSSSEEDVKNAEGQKTLIQHGKQNHLEKHSPVVVRLNSQAPLMENAEPIDETPALDNGYASTESEVPVPDSEDTSL